MSTETDLTFAILAADRLVKKHFKDSLILIKRNTRWRKEPATKKQTQILLRRKINVPDGLTKGQASHLIGMLTS